MKKKVMFVLTQDMQDALNRQAAIRGATLSGLVRSVLGEWLAAQGEHVEWVLPWGGRRDKPTTPQDDNPA